MPKQTTGTTIPDIQVTDLDGQTQRLRDFAVDNHLVLVMLRGLW